MTDHITSLVVVSIFLVLLLVGAPIAFGLIISGFSGLALSLGMETAIKFTRQIFYSNVSDFLLTTVPVFILMAFVLNETGLIRDLFSAFNHWIGHLKGGLAVATTITNGGMAMLSGSSTATIAAMASISIPEMRRYGYDDRLSAGTVAASGTFAILLPPSVALIIYGILTQTSITGLFIAGIVPGMLTLLGYIIVIYSWAYSDIEIMGGAKERSSLSDRLQSIRPIGPAAILIIVVLGSLYTGIVTPTEAGSMGALGAVVIALGIYRTPISDISNAFDKTLEITSMVFLILIGADIFSRFLTLRGIPQTIIEAVSNSGFPPLVILLLILLIYIILGTFMDQLAILILTLPITFPLFVGELGYHPVWFGIFIIKTIEVGLVTPPFGMNVYVLSGTVDGVDIGDAFRGALRFLVVDLVIIGVMIAFPEIVTFVL